MLPTLDQRGFTLVELVSCIVIAGLLASVAVPRMLDQQPFAARGYTDELAQVIRLGQRRAIATECPVQVAIDAAGNYTLLQRALVANNCTGGWTVPVRAADGAVISGLVPNGVNVAPAVTFNFDRNGRPNGVVPMINIDTFALVVDAQTGRVTVTP